MPTDYEERAKKFDFATKEELQTALETEGVILLDVRTQEEIDQSDKFTKPGVTWKQSKCSATACEFLSLPEEVTKLLGSPSNQGEAPIVVYCRSGRRAVTAKKILEEHGYHHILNAGGYDDVANMGL